MSFGGFIQANTQVIVTIGPFVDVGDGFTPETGVTLGAADEAELLKHGSTSVVDISGATWAAVTNCDGYYSLTLTTSHTDTEGLITIVVQDDSVCLPVKMTFQVIAQAAWASLITAKDSGYMDINVKAVSEDTTAADNLESACDNYSVTRGLSGTALPAAAADAAGGLPISDAGGLDLDTQIGTDIDAILTDTADMQPRIVAIETDTNELQTDDIPGTLSTIAGYLDTEIAAILADTNELQGDWTNGGRLDLILDELTTQGDTNEGKLDTIITDTNELQTDWTNGGRLDLIIDAILADTNELQTDDVPGLIGALNDIAASDVWDLASALTLDFGTLLERVYQLLNNEMNITNADGSVALRNLADSADIATGSITDNGTTTSRAAYSWV